MEIIDWIKDLNVWVIHWAQTPYGGLALFVLAFCESSFFPIPPDVLLIALCMANSPQAFWFALLCSLGSTLGGIFGYVIGRSGGRPLLERFVREERIRMVQQHYQRWDVWAVAIAGFTPIPYKVFTIGGGAFKIDFKIFMLASLVSRSLRFMTEGLLLYFFGAPIRDFLYTQFNWLSVAFVVLLVGGFWLVNRVGRRASREP